MSTCCRSGSNPTPCCGGQDILGSCDGGCEAVCCHEQQVRITFHMFEALKKVFDGHVHAADIEEVEVAGKPALIITAHGSDPQGDEYSNRYLAAGGALVTWNEGSMVDIEVGDDAE